MEHTSNSDMRTSSDAGSGQSKPRRKGLVVAGVLGAIAAVMIGASLLGGGGSGDGVAVGSTAGVTTGVSTTTPSSATPTTAAPTTTEPPSTTESAVATSTTEALPRSEVLLRADGVGDARFGMTLADADALLVPALGTPDKDEPLVVPPIDVSVPASVPDGQWGYPVASHQCWGDFFCVTFGGASPDQLTMVGWGLLGTQPFLTDSYGLTVGVPLASAASALAGEPSGCGFIGTTATVEGVWVEFRDDDIVNPTFVDQCVAAPAPTTVAGMASGARIAFMAAGLQVPSAANLVD